MRSPTSGVRWQWRQTGRPASRASTDARSSAASSSKMRERTRRRPRGAETVDMVFGPSTRGYGHLPAGLFGPGKKNAGPCREFDRGPIFDGGEGCEDRTGPSACAQRRTTVDPRTPSDLETTGTLPLQVEGMPASADPTPEPDAAVPSWVNEAR